MTTEATEAPLSDTGMVEAVIASGPRHGERIRVDLSAQELLGEEGMSQLAGAIQELDEAVQGLLHEARELKQELKLLRELPQPNGQLA